MEGNSLNSYINLCKIFEMRINLDKEKKVKTSREVLDNYEKYSKKIDNIYNSEFQKELKPLISPEITIEKEKDRLRRLIKLLEDRLERRVELEDKYYKTTGKYISGLQRIVSDEELDDKRERLSVINKYLDTKEEIDTVTKSIEKLKNSLIEEENKRNEYESKNKLMEDELYSSFMSVINKDEYYKNINEDDINSELDKIRSSVSETKETLDITRESIGSLIGTSIDDDYNSYIEEAEKNYYDYKNKEIILNIYKLVVDFEDDFKLICAKRDKINELLLDKKELINNMIISVDNELESFEKIVLLQDNTLDIEREILDNIANYTSRISFKEERLEELTEANNSVEILAILREYGLIDTYDSEDISDSELSYLSDVNNVITEDNNTILDNIDIHFTGEESAPKFELPSLNMVSSDTREEDSVIEEVYDPYRIVDVIDYPRTLNVGLAKLKGESVREKVNKKLNPVIGESKIEGVNEDTLVMNVEPVIEAPFVMEDVEENLDKEINVIDTPVWELPTENDIKPMNIDVYTSSLPVWGGITPTFEAPIEKEDTPKIESLDIISKPEEGNNIFWVPVSEAKVDGSGFPSLNLPINDKTNKNSEFVFPNINN